MSLRVVRLEKERLKGNDHEGAGMCSRVDAKKGYWVMLGSKGSGDRIHR